MEFSPHKYLCQQNYLDKLNRGIIHRSINRIMGVSNNIDDKFSKITPLVCSEPAIFSSWCDVTGRKVAYGGEALPRLRKEMSNNNEKVACCALRQLSNLLHDPEIAVQALDCNIIPRFVKTLRSNNLTIVEMSLECLKSLSNQPSGMSAIISNKYIVECIKNSIVHPSSPVIRGQASITVNSLAQNYIAVHHLVEAGYVKVLMQSVLEMKDCTFENNNPWSFKTNLEIKEILVRHLDTLDKLMEDSDGAKIEAIAYDAFLLAPFLTSECTKIKTAAACFFCQIAKHPIGKEGIFKHDLVIPLCNGVVHEENPLTKLRMATALQFATIHKEARKQAFRTEVFDYLLKALSFKNLPIALKKSAILLLTNFAELPEGRLVLREYLHSSLEYLIKIERTEEIDELVRRLVEVITWEP